MIIDAHQHFWDPARGDYGWLTEGSPLFRRFQIDDLRPLLDENGVDGTILVQAAPTAAETDYLLDIAERTGWVRGVVGWVDLEADDVAQVVARRARSSLFVGVRPMLQDLTDRKWVLRPKLRGGLEAVAQAGLVFDALIHSDQLGVIGCLAGNHPQLTIVIDHAAKPPFGSNDEMSRWRAHLAQVATHSNIFCKLSGLLTELPAGRCIDDAIAAIKFVFELFGPDRLLWGSDWPVLTMSGDYGVWMNTCRRELREFGPSALDAVMGENARRIYHLVID